MVENPQKHNLLIFGQGPVINKEARERLNLWGENLVRSAAFLYRQGATRRIIVVGGQTGGVAYKSEAELVDEGLVSLGVPALFIDKEKQSTNTIENLVNFCNEFLDTNEQYQNAKLDILGAPYHVTRMKLLMKLFAIPYDHVFSSDEVLRYAAYTSEQLDEQELKEIEMRSDLNSTHYYDSKEDTEKKTQQRRIEEEEVWTRALLEIPEYSLPYFGRLKSDKRLRTILTNMERLFPGVLVEKDIDFQLEDLDSVRRKLSLIERKKPDVDTWVEENKQMGGLSQEIVQKIDMLFRS